MSANGNNIGTVTSGTVSPILDKAIALGYVDIEYAYEGAAINFLIRGKEVPANIVTLPFIDKK